MAVDAMSRDFTLIVATPTDSAPAAERVVPRRAPIWSARALLNFQNTVVPWR